MAIVLADLGAVKLVEEKRTFLSTLHVRLFRNNYTPAHDMVLGDFLECNTPGYSPVVQSYTAPAINPADGTARIEAALIVFTPANLLGPNDIYGYYVTDPNDADDVVYAERFSGGPIPFGVTNLLPLAFYPTLTEASL